MVHWTDDVGAVGRGVGRDDPHGIHETGAEWGRLRTVSIHAQKNLAELLKIK
jgi:hypothetical protein